MKKRIYVGISIYAVTMLSILIVVVLVLGGALYRSKQNRLEKESDLEVNQTVDTDRENSVESTEEESPAETESSIFQENDGTETEEGSEQIPTWIVKEYMGQIGIFNPDGSLEILLDTYVKTLPKADQDLLGEGFEIQGESQFNAILQDYGD